MMAEGSDKMQQRRRVRMAPAERREKILAAAADMFQRHGYAGASIDAIAAASGISGPGIYRYFGGKTELLLALLEAAAAQAVAAVEAAIASDEGPPAARRMADVLADHALIEGPIVALLQNGVGDMDAMGKARLEHLRSDVVARLVASLQAASPTFEPGHAEARIVAALAVVGQVERILATANGPIVFRQVIRSVLDA